MQRLRRDTGGLKEPGGAVVLGGQSPEQVLGPDAVVAVLHRCLFAMDRCRRSPVIVSGL
jgi:hypothetical protein